MDPATAAMVTAVGLLLFYVEMCRPGWILPGAAGAAAVMLGLARLSETPYPPAAVALGCVGAGLVVAETWFRWPGIPGMAGAAVLSWAVSLTAPLSPGRTVVLAAVMQIAAAATVILGSAAKRSYHLKRLDL